MTTLMDVTPQFKTVHGVSIPGGSVAGISYLLQRIPEFRMMIVDRSLEHVTVDRIIEMSPDAVGAVIAVGCGYVPYMALNPDEPPEESAAKLKASMDKQRAAETHAACLPLGVQMDFVEAILDITLPGGVGPFVARWEALADRMSGNSVPVPSGKDQGLNSPLQSS